MILRTSILVYVAILLIPGYVSAANADLVFAHLAIGGGYSTTFTIINTGDDAAVGNLVLTAQDGGALLANMTNGHTLMRDSTFPISIPSGGMTSVTATSADASGTTTAGWAVVRTTGGNLAGVATFQLNAANGALQTIVGVLASPPVSVATIPVDDDFSLNRSTGYAVVNTNSDPITITVEEVGADGTTAASLKSITLDPGCQKAAFFYQDADANPEFKGSATLTGQNGATFSVIALVLNQGLYNAVPVIPAKAHNISGMAPIALRFDTCPQNDPAYETIRTDFQIRREGVVVDAINCTEPASQMPLSEYSDELMVLQALRIAYYMDLGRSSYLPWTSLRFYDWLKTRIGGVNVTAGAVNTYCCTEYDGRLFIGLGLTTDDSNRSYKQSFQGVAANLALFGHEARHVDGFPHVSGCGIANGCDADYDESNLSPYGIQYWMFRAWLNGTINLGFACLPAAQSSEIASWFLNADNSYLTRFVDVKPPVVTMPADPGGPCSKSP